MKPHIRQIYPGVWRAEVPSKVHRGIINTYTAGSPSQALRGLLKTYGG